MQHSAGNAFSDPNHGYFCMDQPYPVNDAKVRKLIDPNEDVDDSVMKYILTYIACCGGSLRGRRCGVVDPTFTHMIFRSIMTSQLEPELPTRRRDWRIPVVLSGYRDGIDYLFIPLFAHSHWTLFVYDSTWNELIFYNSLQPEEVDWPMPRAQFSWTAMQVVADLALRGVRGVEVILVNKRVNMISPCRFE